MSLILSIVGAESTGKSSLVRALAPALAHKTGEAWVCVDEFLREWVDANGRTPRIDEQMGIAALQQSRIAHAAEFAHVVADTSALMTAVYSAVIFGDDSLMQTALDAESAFDWTFVSSLDVPWQSDGLQRDGEHVRAAVDECLIRALTQSERAFVRLTGSIDAQIAQVLFAVRC